MGEHLPCKQGVDSSNLFISTTGSEGKNRRPKLTGKIRSFDGLSPANDKGDMGS